MSIQADKWIKRMSMVPPFIVLHHDAKETVSHQSRQELSFLKDEKKIAHFTEATPENLLRLGWQPMISPFVPSNEREIERNGTEEEALLLKHMGPEYLKKKIGNSVKGFRIDPILGLQVRQRILSYGTSSFGYDVTLGDDFRIFTNVNTGTIDPLDFDEEACLVPFKGDVCIIPPNSYILGVTREYFRIPRDVMVACVGKSTYARCGAIVNVTPIEPGFEGHVVIEISNSTPSPLKVYANQGVAQFMFFKGDEECETSYADKGGKYQGQTGMTLAKV